MAGEGHGPSSFGIPRRSGVPAWHPDNIPDDNADAEANKYRRRLEDIDPARIDPSAMIEQHEPLRPRPSPYTVEGYIQGFRDLSEAAITGQGQRRYRARVLVILSLTALGVPVGLQLLGFLHIL
ncbi:MAG TPA: hypothetical protein VHX15_22265 [Frankiaceae bacterium]|jgi:hypothetical protein|nr:hypothetical protein [Frankiaceae bacterium]